MKRFISLLLILTLLLPQLAFAADAWTCPGCGAERDGGKFCSDCGTARPDDTWTCYACGASVSGKFCSNCGAARDAAPAADYYDGVTIPYEDMEPDFYSVDSVAGEEDYFAGMACLMTGD